MKLKKLNLSVRALRLAGTDLPVGRRNTWSHSTLAKPRKRLRVMCRYRNESFIFKLLTDENKTFNNEFLKQLQNVITSGECYDTISNGADKGSNKLDDTIISTTLSTL